MTHSHPPSVPAAWTTQNLLATGICDHDQLMEALRLLYEQADTPLDDAVEHLPTTPGVYAIGLAKPDPPRYYADLVELGAPLCIGSTITSLRGRLGAYRKKLLRARNLRLADVRVKVISLSRAQAVSTEILLQDACPTPCNKPGPVSGFGPNMQGANRTSRPSAFHTLHPITGAPRVRSADRRAVEQALAAWIRLNHELVRPLMRPPA